MSTVKSQKNGIGEETERQVLGHAVAEGALAGKSREDAQPCEDEYLIVKACLDVVQQYREKKRPHDADVQERFFVLCDLACLLHGNQPVEAIRVFANAVAGLSCIDGKIAWGLRLEGLRTSLRIGTISVGCAFTDVAADEDEICDYWAYRALDAANHGQSERASSFLKEFWLGTESCWSSAIRILAATTNSDWIKEAVPRMRDVIEGKSEVRERRIPELDYKDYYPPSEEGYSAHVEALEAVAYCAARHGLRSEAESLYQSDLGSWAGQFDIIRGFADSRQFDDALAYIEKFVPSLKMVSEQARINLARGALQEWQQALETFSEMLKQKAADPDVWVGERLSMGDISVLNDLMPRNERDLSYRLKDAVEGLESLPCWNETIANGFDEAFAKTGWQDPSVKSPLLRAWRKVLRRLPIPGSLQAAVKSLTYPDDINSMYEAIGSVIYILFKTERKDTIRRIIDESRVLEPGFEEEILLLCS